MKKEIFKSKNLNWILSALIVFSIASCKKQSILGYVPGTGTPTISSVSALYSMVNDTSVTIVQTYDTLGNVSMTVDSNKTHQSFFPSDSTKTQGNKQNYYVIHGTNLGSATTVSFNGTSAYFNRAYGTDNSIIVSIPLSVPTTGAAATNKVTVVTPHGTANFNFTTLTPPPTIATISDYDFWTGSQITLTGVGFATVTSVGISGTTSTATIISQTDGQIVLQFPSVTVNSANLVFSYTSAGKAIVLTTKQVFNNFDNAYVIFYKDNFQNAWADNSWSGPSGVSTNASHSGNASAEATYPSNGWKIEGWANWYPSFPYDASYKYLTFWVKGGTVDQTLTLVGDKMIGGYGQNTSPATIQQIDVPPGVWTFYKIPLGTGAGQLNYWATGSPAQQLGFFLKGQGTDPDETMYFDEIAFLK